MEQTVFHSNASTGAEGGLIFGLPVQPDVEALDGGGYGGGIVAVFPVVPEAAGGKAVQLKGPERLRGMEVLLAV